MITNKNFARRLSALLLAVLMLAVSMPAAVFAEDVQTADAGATVPPVYLLERGTGAQYTFITQGDEVMLCLPGNGELPVFDMTYVGDKQLEVPGTDILLDFQQTGNFAPTVGENTLREYDKATDTYTDHTFTVMQGSAIPSMYITIDEVAGTGFDSTLDWLHDYKDNETTGTLRMTDEAGEVVYDGVLDTFKGRGNTSFVAPGIQGDKKSYNIKLEKKTELIEGAGKMKKWSLIHMRISEAFTYDWTGLCHQLGYQTYAALMGDGYFVNKSQFVDLYLDGEYRGVYILVERLDNGAAVDVTDTEDFVTSESSAKKVVNDINDPAIAAGVRLYRYTADAVAKEEFDVSGGFLLETNFGNLEECGFITAHGMYFDLKAPEACTREQVQYIAKYVQDFENALYSETGCNSEGKHYSEYVDMESLAGMVLTYGFYQNWELFRTSTYAYLDVADSDHPKLTFGPVWDFETGAGILTGDATLFGKHNVYKDTQQYIWLEQLWQKGDFLDIVYNKAQELVPIINATLGLGAEIDGVRSAQTILSQAHDSLVMNWTRWGLEDYLNGKSQYRGHENDFDYYADEYIEALKARRVNWNKLWNEEEYLFGVSVDGNREKESGTTAMFCTARSGALISYQWYKVSEYGIPEEIAGATGARYVTDQAGEYFCLVSGPSNAYYSGAKGDIFSRENINVYSPVFNTAYATEVDKLPDETHIPGEWEVEIEPDCDDEGLRVKRCTVCEGREVLASERIPVLGHEDGEWTVEREATEWREGLEVLRCSKCNDVIDQRVIERIYVNKFTDVDESRWYKDAVRFAVQNGLFNGISATEFDPDGAMTRGMLVTVLARLEGVDINNEQPTGFSDVKPGRYYSGAVVWAAENGIVKGIAERTFAPEDNVTREQTATILMRYAESKELDVSARADLSAYEDADSISNYAKDAVAWVNAMGIMKGTSATTLAPNDNCTRAQVAEMLRLFCEAAPGLSTKS